VEYESKRHTSIKFFSNAFICFIISQMQSIALDNVKYFDSIVIVKIIKHGVMLKIAFLYAILSALILILMIWYFKKMKNTNVKLLAEKQKKMEDFFVFIKGFAKARPYVTLFAVFAGIIKNFHDLSLSGEGGPSLVTAVVIEVLLTSVIMVLIQILTLVILNRFRKKVIKMQFEIYAATDKK
jgi:hypothetical protein